MIDFEYNNNSRDGIDLMVYQCGMEKCVPSHSFGPAIRDHYLIHYILNGQGTFRVKDKTYNLKQDQLFLICPNVVTYYEANIINPWHYAWIGFHGLKAETYLKYSGLDEENPIFTYKNEEYIKNCFFQMMAANNLKYSSQLRLKGLLYNILAELIESSDSHKTAKENYKEIYIQKSIQFIQMNYSSNITISSIADYVGLNRSYFSTLFKSYTNKPPQQFLMEYRINKACELIQNSTLSISEISRSVGYEDPLGFSKIFKKLKNSSPKDFRKK